MVDELLTWRFGSRSVEFIEPIGAAGRPNTLTGWYTQMEMLIGGTWQPAASGRTEDVTSPFGGTVTGTVPVADAADVRPALDRAGDGVVTWRRTPASTRAPSTGPTMRSSARSRSSRPPRSATPTR